ncbi:MAG: class I SAM-dependent methyltransferase [Candidatus Omnitrophota bacterium]
MKESILSHETKTKYDEDYRDKKFGGPGYVHKWILELLRPTPKTRLLDIGCSQGYLLAEADKAGLLTYGVDISQEAVNMARENSPNSHIVCDDAHSLQWKDEYFDYITNIGSLEHFKDPDTCLAEMKRVLKWGGKACIMLPNQHYYRHVINKVVWKKDPTSYQSIERFASLAEWREMLDDNGLIVEKVYKYNKFNRNKFLIFVRSLVIPVVLSHHFVFICRRDDR